MLKLNIGDKELKIKFGYKPTLKERVISKMAKLSKSTKKNDESEQDNDRNKEQDFERIEDLLLYIPEILLVGLQTCHKEYRYDYDTKEGKQEQLDKVFDLIDEYATNGGDLMGLFNQLYEEMQNDSFLSSLFRKEEAAEQIEETTQKAADEAKKEN